MIKMPLLAALLQVDQNILTRHDQTILFTVHLELAKKAVRVSVVFLVQKSGSLFRGLSDLSLRVNFHNYIGGKRPFPVDFFHDHQSVSMFSTLSDNSEPLRMDLKYVCHQSKLSSI